MDLSQPVLSIGGMYRIGSAIVFRHWLPVLLEAIFVVVTACVAKE